MIDMKRYGFHLDEWAGLSAHPEWKELPDGEYVKYSDAAARCAQVEATLQEWKDAAPGCQTPEDLEKLVDTRLDAIFGGDTRVGDALSELAEQGQDIDLAENWQKRAEAAESEVTKLKEALRQLLDANKERFSEIDGALLPPYEEPRATLVREATKKAEAVLATSREGDNDD
jgi:hypothetical protein